MAGSRQERSLLVGSRPGTEPSIYRRRCPAAKRSVNNGCAPASGGASRWLQPSQLQPPCPVVESSRLWGQTVAWLVWSGLVWFGLV